MLAARSANARPARAAASREPNRILTNRRAKPAFKACALMLRLLRSIQTLPANVCARSYGFRRVLVYVGALGSTDSRLTLLVRVKPCALTLSCAQCIRILRADVAAR